MSTAALSKFLTSNLDPLEILRGVKHAVLGVEPRVAVKVVLGAADLVGQDPSAVRSGLLRLAAEFDPLVPRRRILAGEPCGVCELPVVVLSGIINEDARRVLRERHIRMDRSVGVYQVIANCLLWGMQGTPDLGALEGSYVAAAGDRTHVHDMLVVGPKVAYNGYTYGLLVPRMAATGFFVDSWVPGPASGPASL